MNEDPDDRAGRDPAPAVTRSIRLLGLLADARHPLTLTEIASGLALAKSSTANLCLALESARMIERVAAGYRLGMRTAELGGAFASQFTQIREFYSVCESSPVLASELVQMVIMVAFGPRLFDLSRLICRVPEANTRAIIALLKIGFRIEYRDRASVIGGADGIVLSLDRDAILPATAAPEPEPMPDQGN